MFQNYEVNSDPSTGKARLEALRKQMRQEKLDIFLVPHADEHQNEYLPARAERLAWLTGFTGSAGFALIAADKAIVFVDGRYTLQLREQVDGKCFSGENLIELPPSKWLAANAAKGDRIGYDPWLISLKQRRSLSKSADDAGASLVPCDNLIDRIWQDQPPAPLGSVKIHDASYAGKLPGEKIAEIQKAIGEKGAELCLLSDPASLAWMFNIRGSDLAHSPMALGFCLLPANSRPLLFMDKRKLPVRSEAYLTQLADLYPPATLEDELAKLCTGKTVLCDPALVASALGDIIEKAKGKIMHGRDPVVLPRAIKNETEINGARAAHLRDGVAVTRFLHWLDHQNPGTVDEINAAKRLEKFRADTALQMNARLCDISFDTISGAGANGAIVHYRVNERSNQKLEDGTLYLCDSGGQYIDGTTDITRTLAIGNPPQGAIEDFTLVLKGHIALALARFPKGTRGVDLDTLARNALWQRGKDYGHGTGHGVGSYLNVHEGPQSISKRGMEPLLPGMIISNEPGYYIEGQYGIRIENLVVVREAEELPGGTILTHSFETLTLAPIDLALVNANLLSGSEREWLNAYHQRVRESLSEHLDANTNKWLATATRVI